MFNLKTALLSTLAVALTAGAANAGTEVFNRYEHTNTYNGQSETNVDAHIYTESTSTIDSISIKSESYGGTTNISEVSITDTGFEATSHSSNEVVVDPVAIVTVIQETSTIYSVEDVNVDTFSSYEFDGRSFEHTAGNRSN